MKNSIKKSKRYYHFNVEVLVFDKSINTYKLWYVQTFSSKRNYLIWYYGFVDGIDLTIYPFSRRIGNTYVKYRNYPPRF